MRRAGAVVDVVAIVVFVVIGRASHHHGESAEGFLSTIWPFAAGVGVGWLLTWRRQGGAVRTGLVECLATVAVGMALRVVAGQGTAPGFIAVALGFLAACMVGGRALAGAAHHWRRSWSAPAR